ncbi:MAG: transposase, partial [Clostridia bacterium]|nr:transposase [Clostridia bacterium]
PRRKISCPIFTNLFILAFACSTGENEICAKLLTVPINKRPSMIVKETRWERGQRKRREREKPKVRAKVERVFGIEKKQFRYRKTRYRGLTKTAVAHYMKFTLANLILADRRSPAA